MAERQEEHFLNLADDILVIIFQQLRVGDLFRCMSVCKRFKNVTAMPKFWKHYVQKRYNFEQIDGNTQDELTKYNLDTLSKEWYCFWDNSNEIPPPNDSSRFVFRPFPQMWVNGIITPSNFLPLSEENDYDYNAFNKALYLLLQLRKKIDDFQITSTPYYSDIDSVLDVCLFPWKGEQLPEATQVLKIFNVHEELQRLRLESDEEFHVAERLDYELEEYFDADTDYERDITLLNNTFSGICRNENRQEDFYKWVQNLFQPSLMFCAGKDAIHPQLYFHLTLLSPGWVGGVFSTISLV